MAPPALTVHFMAPHSAEGSDVMARQESEAVQEYFRSPDILYRYEHVAYADLWEKAAKPSLPDVLHIVAHGADGQLLAANTYLEQLAVSAHQLAIDVKNHLGSHLRYIYLGVCDSAALARALAVQGYTVLCFEGKVAPERGIFFAKTFYKFFVQEKKDFYTAYTAAKNSWKANGYHTEGVVPRFYCAESDDFSSFIWHEGRYKQFLEKLNANKVAGLLARLFDELGLDANQLEPWNLPAVYRYLKSQKMLFSLRDQAEVFFLDQSHAYTDAYKDIETGLIEPSLKASRVDDIQKYTAIEAQPSEYARRLLVGPLMLADEGLKRIARELALPLGLDYERTKDHLLRKTPVLQTNILLHDTNETAMSPESFMAWMIRNKKRFFVISGAAGAGKTTFLIDAVRAHFQKNTAQKVFIARFNHAEVLRAQLKAWEKDALGNILILDALDELYDDADTILGLLEDKHSEIRAFSKVVLGFRDTFLKANKPLRKAIDAEDWTLLKVAPLEYPGAKAYLRACFPVHNAQEQYAAALRFVKEEDTMPPALRYGVTPFLLYHIQYLLDNKPVEEAPATYWDVMRRLADKMMEKMAVIDGYPNDALKRGLVAFFKDRVMDAYNAPQDKYPPFWLMPDELEGQPVPERILRNFSLLSRIEQKTGIFYTFSHAHFKDYFLALLLAEGRIREIDFDKAAYPDAYRLYQDYCWKCIAPDSRPRYDWHPVVAHALPCFAFQVMAYKYGGQLPTKYPSISKYFRAAFKSWAPGTWQKARALAARETAGEDNKAHLDHIRRNALVEPAFEELSSVINWDTHTFVHPLCRDAFAFFYHQEQGGAAALDFLDKSAFSWLFRYERNWLEYGEQAEAFSLVYIVKDDDSTYTILKSALGIDAFTDFDQEVYAALQTPAMLERYYGDATQVRAQVHAATLPAHLLNSIPFPAQLIELSIGGDTALTGEWDMRAFANLEVLDLGSAATDQLHITHRPPSLEVIIHPRADQIPVADGGAAGPERLTSNMGGHWLEQVPASPLPPDLAPVEGGTFEMGAGWFEAAQAFSREYYKSEIPDEDCIHYPSYEAEVATFYMAKYPVTVGEFARFVKATGYRTRAERFGFAFGAHVYIDTRDGRNTFSNYLLPGLHWRHSVWGDTLLYEDAAALPVVYISYEDAKAYAQWLTDTIGNGGTYRLPTEAEWEYAAKGGRLTRGYIYAGSDDVGEVAQYIGKEPVVLRPAGPGHLAEMGKPNELGLYDMSGNVWEWCADWYGGDYYAQCRQKEEMPVRNPPGPDTGSLRVLRGGGWLCRAGYCRAAYRNGYHPDDRNGGAGFRLVFVP